MTSEAFEKWYYETFPLVTDGLHKILVHKAWEARTPEISLLKEALRDIAKFKYDLTREQITATNDDARVTTLEGAYANGYEDALVKLRDIARAALHNSSQGEGR